MCSHVHSGLLFNQPFFPAQLWLDQVPGESFGELLDPMLDTLFDAQSILYYHNS